MSQLPKDLMVHCYLIIKQKALSGIKEIAVHISYSSYLYSTSF